MIKVAAYQYALQLVTFKIKKLRKFYALDWMKLAKRNPRGTKRLVFKSFQCLRLIYSGLSQFIGGGWTHSELLIGEALKINFYLSRI